ncbi:MAG: hypothetical protein ACTSPV_00655 [Candidatus Hodarchaeales archaeon]
MLRAYCVDSIIIVRHQGEDSWGEPLTPIEIKVKGYVDWETHLIRNIAGEQVVSRGTVTIIYDESLTHQDFIKINGTQYAILDVRQIKDFSIVGQKVHLA